MHHLDGLSGTGAGAVAAAFAGRGVNLDDPCPLVDTRHCEGAGAYAGQADDALLRVHTSHRPAHVHLLLSQDADGPGRSTLGLGDAFLKELGAMGQATQENAAGTEELSSQAEELNSQVAVLLKIVEGQSRERAGFVTGKAHETPQVTMKTSSKEVAMIPTKNTMPKDVIPLEDDFKDF